MLRLPLAIVASIFALPTVFAFKWNFSVASRQCSNVTINVTESGNVVFPLKVLVVPVGPSPLPVEVRKVMEVLFPSNGTSVSFRLPYPSGSQFVGLVSDAKGYRGRANTMVVGPPTSDATCFDTTKDAAPSFNFTLSPTDVAECKDVRISWSPDSIQGVPSFISVIPNLSFGPIPIGIVDNQAGLGRGFTWAPPVRAASNLIIVAGEDGGGFISTFVSPGNPNRDSTGACPAPTASANTVSTATPTSKAEAAQATNTPLIVGLVIGASIVVLGLVGIIFRLWRRKEAKEPQTLFPYIPPSLFPPTPNYLERKRTNFSGSSPVTGSPSQPQMSHRSQEQPPEYVATPGVRVQQKRVMGRG